HQRRQAEGRLVEQQQLRPQHQRARDRQHLLLAARERARLLASALPESREIAVDALEILRDLLVATGIGAEAQILLDAEADEGPAPVRHMADAEADDVLGGNVV